MRNRRRVGRAVAVTALTSTVLAFGSAQAQAQTESYATAYCPGADAVPAVDNFDQVEAAVLCLHNVARAEAGLRPLRAQPQLQYGAALHSYNMAVRNFFDHRGMKRRIRRTGYTGKRNFFVGENLAWGVDNSSTARSIFDGWMRSPNHRINILEPRFRELGVGLSFGYPMPGPDIGITYTANFGVRGR